MQPMEMVACRAVRRAGLLWPSRSWAVGDAMMQPRRLPASTTFTRIFLWCWSRARSPSRRYGGRLSFGSTQAALGGRRYSEFPYSPDREIAHSLMTEPRAMSVLTTSSQ
jgi:hypothetical protein